MSLDVWNYVAQKFFPVSEQNALVNQQPKRLRDNLGKLEVSEAQNLFSADFEYSAQPMRWEIYTAGAGSITPISSSGGVQMSVTSAAGDLAVRQTRPYFRYQPGKTQYMSTGLLFGQAYTNQRQRVGFFDDANGCFFEQGDPTTVNPTGMNVVVRTDGGIQGIVETRIPMVALPGQQQWADPYGIVSGNNPLGIKFSPNAINMYYVEYAWYGAGAIRWGLMIQGEPYIVHEIGFGNLNANTPSPQQAPWARTGNLPVRYEMRNVGPSSPGSMSHYGVSVLAKGKIDVQRGFTYGYGQAANVPVRTIPANATRYPLLSIRYRTMGTLEYGADSAYSGANGTLPTGGAAITGVTQSATSTLITASSATWAPGQWVNKYLFARGSTASISAITASSGSAVATTSANPNYLVVGQRVTVSGATGNTTVNGTFVITAVSANTFTYTGSGITSGAVGGTLVYTVGQGGIGRIIANSATTLTVVDNVQSSLGYTFPMTCPPAVSGNYIIGLIDRGQIAPLQLEIASTANCVVELISSTYQSPIVLTGATFNTMYSLGSLNSFTERDVSATAMSGGEVVKNDPCPAGALQFYDLSTFFPLFNNVQGNQPDILTVAISTAPGSAVLVGGSIYAQEEMS